MRKFVIRALAASIALPTVASAAEAPASTAPASAPVAPAPASAAAPASAPVAPAAPPTVTLHIAAQFPTGKWPEDVNIAGDDAFVADSGDRRLTHIALKTGKTTTTKVGRFPTALYRGADGAEYVLVETDKTIVRVGPDGASKIVARLPDCPSALTGDADALYVLLWMGCSSAESGVARLDLKAGLKAAPKQSATLGADAFSIAAAGGHVYVSHRSGMLSVLDAHTLAPAFPDAFVQVRDLVRADPATGAVFVDGEGRVARVDPQTGAVTHTAEHGRRVVDLALHGDTLYVALDDGDIRTYAAADLTPRQILKIAEGPLEIRAMAFWGDDLVVAIYRDDDAKDDAAGKPPGRLLVLR